MRATLAYTSARILLLVVAVALPYLAGPRLRLRRRDRFGLAARAARLASPRARFWVKARWVRFRTWEDAARA